MVRYLKKVCQIQQTYMFFHCHCMHGEHFCMTIADPSGLVELASRQLPVLIMRIPSAPKAIPNLIFCDKTKLFLIRMCTNNFAKVAGINLLPHTQACWICVAVHTRNTCMPGVCAHALGCQCDAHAAWTLLSCLFRDFKFPASVHLLGPAPWDPCKWTVAWILLLPKGRWHALLSGTLGVPGCIPGWLGTVMNHDSW